MSRRPSAGSPDASAMLGDRICGGEGEGGGRDRVDCELVNGRRR